MFSQNLSTAFFEDFAEMLGIELVVIDAQTNLRAFKTTLRLGEVIYNRNY